MNTHIPYYRNPCQNSSAVSYRPIEKVSIYIMEDLCRAFADKHPIELEGLRGVIVSMWRSNATPDHSIVISLHTGSAYKECEIRIK